MASNAASTGVNTSGGIAFAGNGCAATGIARTTSKTDVGCSVGATRLGTDTSNGVVTPAASNMTATRGMTGTVGDST